MGKAWSASTINGNRARGTDILNNELYIGRLVWNRQSFIKDPVTGKRQARLNGEEKWVIEDVPHLRIIDDGLWNQVKGRQTSVKRNTDPTWVPIGPSGNAPGQNTCSRVS